jgi:hypothetical protein
LEEGKCKRINNRRENGIKTKFSLSGKEEAKLDENI